jgi:chorismate synthase
MTGLDYRTAGESHGQALMALVEGMPAEVSLDAGMINAELGRRQGGYGRGGRMRIERDEVNILSGIRQGKSIGSPIAMQIVNRDWRIDDAPALHCPRPGHADLAGSLKWQTTDCRNVLERASARETAARVAAGALSRCLLGRFGIDVVGFVRQIGPIEAEIPHGLSVADLRAKRDANEAYCPDDAAAEQMIAAIRKAKVDKDTLGGIVEAQVHGAPAGLGSCGRWQDKLDGRLMQAVGSVQAIKGVEIGLGFEAGRRAGSAVHDPLDFDTAQVSQANVGFVRRRNNAGGLEGGMTNGEPVVVRAAMKPISTLLQGMDSVNLNSRESQRSDYERSDVCAVPACSVVVENVVAFEIARALREKFGGDTLGEMLLAWHHHMEAVRELGG